MSKTACQETSIIPSIFVLVIIASFIINIVIFVVIIRCFHIIFDLNGCVDTNEYVLANKPK